MTESWTIATRPEIRWGVARWSMFRDSGVTFGVFTIAYLVKARVHRSSGSRQGQAKRLSLSRATVFGLVLATIATFGAGQSLRPP